MIVYEPFLLFMPQKKHNDNWVKSSPNVIIVFIFVYKTGE